MGSPIILATWSFGRIATAAGWPILEHGGDAIDAVEAGCVAVEADPAVNSVGVGGVPDRSGRVSLDGCIMLSPSRCAGVGCIRRFAHPVSIARRVMEKTDHLLLAGSDADDFAEEEGFEPAELLTEAAKQRWRDLMAKRAAGKGYHARDREERTAAGAGATPHDASEEPPHDTVGVLALDANGVLAGACSTSGLPLKLPGRVGDSPIIGHGLYVEPGVGAVVGTGTGERIMGVCGSFLAVELMRNGASPLEALREIERRVEASYRLKESDQAAFIALAPDGRWAAAALRPGFRTAVRDRERDDYHEPDHIHIAN